MIAAKEAEVTSVFYDGARWDALWVDNIFPGTIRHPHRIDAIIDDLSTLLRMARRFVISEND